MAISSNVLNFYERDYAPKSKIISVRHAILSLNILNFADFYATHEKSFETLKNFFFLKNFQIIFLNFFKM